MRRIATLMFAAGLFASLMACETSDSPTMPDIDTEDPTGSWALQSFEPAGGAVVPIPDPLAYTLDLGVNEPGRANLRADCNVCNSSYEVSGSAISFGLMACTLAACPSDSFERDYVDALGTTTLFQRSGESGEFLTLGYEGGVMHFEPR